MADQETSLQPTLQAIYTLDNLTQNLGMSTLLNKDDGVECRIDTVLIIAQEVQQRLNLR